MEKMRPCEKLHPTRFVSLSFNCTCPERYRQFVESVKTRSLDELFAMISRVSRWRCGPSVQDKMLYGIHRSCEFEPYGRASETFDLPWCAYISKDFADDAEYLSPNFREIRGAVVWLAFHLSLISEKKVKERVDIASNIPQTRR